MTDGQYFYFAILAGLLLGVILEYLWAHRR